MVRHAAPLLLVLVLAACGSDDPNPGPSMDSSTYYDTFANTCTGCTGCCQNGQCMPGTTTMACGIGGLSCRECFTGQSCVGGTCIDQGNTCSTTCNGCCTVSGQCIDPATDANCGLSGLPCQTCTSEQKCEGGACKSTAASIITVTVLSAQVSNSDCGYTGYDDACDPFVVMKLGQGAEHTSGWIEDTEEPVWNDAKIDVDRSLLLSETLSITIWDDDSGVSVNPHDLIDSCELSVKEADLTAGTLTTACGEKVQNLKITFAAAAN